MAETAVGFVIDYLTPLLIEETKLLRGVHSEVSGIKRELVSIQCFLKDADKKAESEANTSTTTTDGVKAWVKQLREVSFRIEDIVDEYIFYLAQHPRRESCFIDSVDKFVGCIVKLKPRHRIASQIQDLKREVCEINERSKTYGFNTTGERSTTPPTDVSWYDPRKAAQYLKEAEVVGIESPKAKLISWMLDEQQSQRTVISVVGMGGLGKTTLAKQVYDSVKENFDCHAWITVSQSYQKEDLLKNAIKKFCHGRKEPIPEGIEAMDEEALINKLREYLCHKRYVVVFDDVWKKDFWGDIEHALLDHAYGARIVITSRNMEVAHFCKISALVHVHEMQHLPPEKARELFCKRVFKSEQGQCPTELLKLSDKIVDKCHGVPLAIVAITGLLSTKRKTIDEWTKMHDSLSSELEDNPHLISITRILSLSYSDLPHHLKSCFMYFCMYPEDYSIRCSRIIRQWIAEGFVNEKKNKTLEEVAHEYLTELINRSLVQVSIAHRVTEKARECRIHDLMREVILRKMEDSSFCHVFSENQSTFREGQVTRRLSFVQSSFDVLHNADQISQVRSILNFNTGDGISLDMSILITHTKNFKLLKVLDFEDGPLNHVHEDVGNLFHLRYLSLRNTKVKMLPRSIGKLVNLETLDLKQSFVFEIPDEIYRLCKLRHLLGYNRDYTISVSTDRTKAIKIKAGIGCFKFLQKLYAVEVNEIGVIKELGQLTQLRRLGIQKLRREDGKVLCECIGKMKHLETLDVTAMSEDDFIDLDYNMSSPPKCLRNLYLGGRLRKLPEWITKLENLLRIGIYWSKLGDDPLKILKSQHNLLDLQIERNAYDGEILQFEKGVFPRLKTLLLRNLSGLNSIIIEEGALPNLQQLDFGPSPHMKEVPFGIYHLKMLKYLFVYEMPDEFVKGMRPEGQHRHVVKHIPFVYYVKGQRRRDFEYYRL